MSEAREGTYPDAALRIDSLTPERVDEAVDAVAEAFHGEPITARLFDLDDPITSARHARAVKLELHGALEEGDPVTVALQDGHVVGVAVTSRLRLRTVMRALGVWMTLVPRMRRGSWRVGLAAMPVLRVPRPHLLLSALAVAPRSEGRGVGSALLHSIIDRCHEGETCRGVYLQVASDRAMRVYTRAGFKPLRTRKAGDLTVTHMFRPADRQGYAHDRRATPPQG